MELHVIKGFLRRNGCTDVKLAEFHNKSRVTMMSCISADDDIAPTLFIFRGKKMPFLTVRKVNKIVKETLSSHVPRKSLVYMREELAVVDSKCFYE